MSDPAIRGYEPHSAIGRRPWCRARRWLPHAFRIKHLCETNPSRLANLELDDLPPDEAAAGVDREPAVEPVSAIL